MSDLSYYIKDHDKQIRADAIDDFANWLVEQGILGNRCISDGEITDYGKVYAKKYKEQLKLVENQPTAYDVDKVVEELELHSFELGTDTLPVHYVRLDEAIEIVKKNIPLIH